MMLLPPGEHAVDIMTDVEMSPRRRVLMAKMQEGIQANPEWYYKQMQKADSKGGPAPYDARLGMTRSEWLEFVKITSDMKDMKAVSTGKAPMKVLWEDSAVVIGFGGSLSFMDDVRIDTRKNQALTSTYALTTSDTLCILSADNVFKSAWRGYKWSYVSSSQPMLPPTVGELSKSNLIKYQITVGLFEASGKTYIEIFSGVMTEGNVKKYTIPLVF